MFMEWDDDMSVGIRTIDDQHQSLIGMINRLHDAMRERRGSEVLGDILNSLVDYTTVHFRTEEAFFTEYEYAEADTHKAEHKKLIAEVNDIQQKFQEGKPMLTMEVMSFLKDWLADHIKVTDKKYSSFFKERGLK